MTGYRLLAAGLVAGILLTPEPASRGQDKRHDKVTVKELAAAGAKGLDWLTRNQAADGSWGKSYTIGITSMACLAYLSASDEPFTDERGKALIKGLQFLMANQKDGMFQIQGQSVRSWIHN
ncbi:MAG: hypothetical protein FJ271_31555 [Planctomycetes bacterium]|nr:hypothetical protein [Planctomycetota bacterium]